VGRFTERLTAHTVDTEFGDDLDVLVRIVLKALRSKPGAW